MYSQCDLQINLYFYDAWYIGENEEFFDFPKSDVNSLLFEEGFFSN